MIIYIFIAFASSIGLRCQPTQIFNNTRVFNQYDKYTTRTSQIYTESCFTQMARPGSIQLKFMFWCMERPRQDMLEAHGSILNCMRNLFGHFFKCQTPIKLDLQLQDDELFLSQLMK